MVYVCLGLKKANLGTWISFSSCLWLEKLGCKGEKQKGIAKDSTGFLKTLFNVDVLKPVVFDYLFNKQKLGN